MTLKVAELNTGAAQQRQIRTARVVEHGALSKSQEVPFPMAQAVSQNSFAILCGELGRKKPAESRGEAAEHSGVCPHIGGGRKGAPMIHPAIPGA